MEVKTLSDEKLQKIYEISIPMDSIMQSVNAEIVERRRTFKIAGFREGTVPLRIVENQIGGEVLQQYVDTRINEVVEQLKTEKKLDILGRAEVEVSEFDVKKELKLKVTFNISPEFNEINWQDPKFSAIKKFKPNITEEEISKIRNEIKEANGGGFNSTDDQYQAQNGDAVVVDFVGKIDGKEFDGNKARSLRIVIGSNQFIPGFEEQLETMKKGDEKKISVTFPDDYHEKEIAGKDAEFDIKAIEVLKKNTADDDADLDIAKKMGFDDLAKFNDALKNRMQIDFLRMARLYTKKKIFDVLDDVLDTEVSESMINEDLDSMLKEVMADKQKNPAKFKNKSDEAIKEDLIKLAKRRVKLGMFLASFSNKNNISISKDDIEKLKQMEKAQNPDQEAKIDEFYKKNENLNKISGALLEEKMIDFLLENCIKPEEEEITIVEFQEKYGKELG